MIKRFSDFNNTSESHNLKEPAVSEPKVKEPATPKATIREPMVKRSDKKLIRKPIMYNSNNKSKDGVNEALKSIDFINKVAIFKHSVKASDALFLLESVKVDKNKLWYIMMERNETTLQVVKYNPSVGFNLTEFVVELYKHYKQSAEISEHLTEHVCISGGKEFAVISNLNAFMLNQLKLDLIKLLSK